MLAVLLLGACWAIYQLMLQHGRLSLQLQTLERKLREQGISTGSEVESSRGLKPGSVPNNFELPLLGGGTMTLYEHRGSRLVLMFLDPSCAYSQSILPELCRLSALSDPGLPRVLIVSTADRERNRELFANVRFPVLLQERMEVAHHNLAFGTPMGYLLDEEIRTVGKLLVGADALLAAAGGGSVAAPAYSGRAYSQSSADASIQWDGLKAGTVAPPFTLPGLDGSSHSLESYRGRPLLLVFSDPECEPCQRLLPQLEQVHRRGAARVLMIGRGDTETNRALAQQHKLTFAVALQRHWEISRAYRIVAAPVAFLIDDAGVLASDALIGADAILKVREKELAWQ